MRGIRRVGSASRALIPNLYTMQGEFDVSHHQEREPQSEDEEYLEWLNLWVWRGRALEVFGFIPCFPEPPAQLEKPSREQALRRWFSELHPWVVDAYRRYQELSLCEQRQVDQATVRILRARLSQRADTLAEDERLRTQGTLKYLQQRLALEFEEKDYGG